MDAMFWFNVFMRWLHVLAAAAALGTTLVLRFVILPAAERDGAGLMASLRPGVKRVVHGALGLAIVTGLYNYLVVAAGRLSALKAQVASGVLPAAAIERLRPYHAVMGVKIVLAVALFAIAIMLLKPVPALERNRRTWLGVNLVLGMLIFLLAAYLRRIW